MSNTKVDNTSPQFTLQYCIDMVKTIYENYGSSTYLSREQMAEIFKVSPSNMILKVSACVKHGLLDKRQGDGYKPSNLFFNILKPLSENEKKEAMIEAFQSPGLFHSLIEQFKGDKVPSKKALETILFRQYDMNDKASNKAANIFLKSLRSVDLLDDQGFLSADKVNIGNDDDNEDDTTDVAEEKDSIDTPVENTPAKQPSSNTQQYVVKNDVPPVNIHLKGGRIAQLLVPGDVKKEDLETIVKWIDLLKESYE